MSGIFFDDKTHTYLVDGKEVPSVTEILAPLHRGYGKIAQSTLDYAAARGTRVHQACEDIDLDLEPEIDYETEGFIRAYLEWLSVYRPKWDFIEHIVYDESGYIGTLDRAGRLNGGEYAVVDIKTSQPTKEALVSVCAQTHAYATALYLQEESIPEGTEIKRYGLFLKKDGTFRWLDCEDYERKYNFKAKHLWEELFLCDRLVRIVLEGKVK